MFKGNPVSAKTLRKLILGTAALVETMKPIMIVEEIRSVGRFTIIMGR